jgi:hypothetical protein
MNIIQRELHSAIFDFQCAKRSLANCNKHFKGDRTIKSDAMAFYNRARGRLQSVARCANTIIRGV